MRLRPSSLSRARRGIGGRQGGTVYQGGTVKKRLECIHDFSQPGQSWGFENFITSAHSGARSFYASVYVSSVDVDDKRTLFCAALNKLDEQLRDNIDKAHPARTFFSKIKYS